MTPSIDKIDPFKYVDAAMPYTDEQAVANACNHTWSDLDDLVGYIMDFIPERRKEEYLETVTSPNF